MLDLSLWGDFALVATVQHEVVKHLKREEKSIEASASAFVLNCSRSAVFILTLVGPKGEDFVSQLELVPGDQGLPGEQGAPGQRGSPGVSGRPGFPGGSQMKCNG